MWIERLFSKFSALYGASFGRMWQGSNIEEVKAVWAEKLAGFSASNIKGALDACDERQYPPNLPEFVSLCRTDALHEATRKQAAAVMLQAPVSKERAEQLHGIANKPKEFDYRGWAKHLREEYLSGVHLLPRQIALASEAFGEVWANRQCNPRVEA